MTAPTRTRIGWADLPEPVRSRVEEIVGGTVVEARSQVGGFSPGTADRVVLADGGRAFVKATSESINEDSARLARAELRIAATLPGDAPVPPLIGGFAEDSWVVTIFRDIEGTSPAEPWSDHDIDLVVTGLNHLADTLTPAPPSDAPRTADCLAGLFRSWEKVEPDDPWTAKNLPALRAASARGLAALATGDTLTHGDIRNDNVLIRPDDTPVFVDWPWASVGPAWLDRVLLAMNVIVAGGEVDRALAGLDPRTTIDVVAGFLGFFRHAGRLPDPEGLPTVRAFQRTQAEALTAWLTDHPL